MTLWSYQCFVDTISHLSQEQGSDRCPEQIEVFVGSTNSSKSEPEKVRHQNDVPPIGRCPKRLLRLAEEAQLQSEARGQTPSATDSCLV